jgi:DNA-binding IscR family transcriptional regulator
MKHQQVVQFAVQCLQALDANQGKPLSLHALSRTQGVPYAECVSVISRLDRAGIVELAAGGSVALRRPVEDLTALEIIQAVWSFQDARPAFRMLIGAHRGIRSKVTRQFVRSAQTADEGGLLNG